MICKTVNEQVAQKASASTKQDRLRVAEVRHI